jgi:hypothetical protein
MAIYTLYKKVDKNSGLHYLGMTTQDPYTYPGSGSDWSNHLRNNITDVETTVVYQTTDKQDFNQTGRYYSKLWNIVGAMDDFGNKIWANSIPETGGGPGWKTGDDNPMNDPVVRNKVKTTLNTEYHKEKRSGDNNCMRNPVVKAKVAATVAKPEHKEQFSKTMKEVLARPEVYSKLNLWTSEDNPMKDPVAKAEWYKKMVDDKVWENRFKDYTPSSHGRYDHTVYSFYHTDGTLETCQRYELQVKYNLNQGKLSELVRGKRLTYKGWSLADIIDRATSQS